MDSDSGPKLRSLIPQLMSLKDTTNSEFISLLIQIISLVSSSIDLDSQPESKLMSLVSQAISIFNSMDLDSQPKPLSDLISFFSQEVSIANTLDLDSEPKLISLISQLASLEDTMKWDLDSDSDSEAPKPVPALITQIISLVSSMDLDSQPKPESKLMSLVSQAIYVFNSLDLDSQSKQLSKLISFFSRKFSRVNSIYSDSEPEPDSESMSLVDDIGSLEPRPELISLIDQILSFKVDSVSKPDDELEFDDWLYLYGLRFGNKRESLGNSVDSELESKLISLITKLMSIDINGISEEWKVLLLTTHIISVVSSMELDPQPKSESELMLLVSQAISVFNSLDLDSQPKPLSELMSLVTQTVYFFNSIDLDSQPKQLSEFISLITQNMSLASPNWYLQLRFIVNDILILEPEPELISLIHHIFSLVISMNSKWEKLVSLSPQAQVRFEEGEENFLTEISLKSNNKWECLYGKWEKFSSTGKGATHFFCKGCNGQNHEDYEKAPLQIKHPLHPRHSLQLVLLDINSNDTKRCYSCDHSIRGAFYYCLACNFAIDYTCVLKPRVLSIDNPKWHEHTLAFQLGLLSHATCAP
ncbi:unnamed protein product [Arabis nemorensis]|uniref:DC1 domain-containing protein n=1 Tax=Arabis nemorensis TaxID=586526 RepID=A0A565CHL5_9BRAS|nr:unnamed protein product [Arabis nemorensis]